MDEERRARLIRRLEEHYRKEGVTDMRREDIERAVDDFRSGRVTTTPPPWWKFWRWGEER